MGKISRGFNCLSHFINLGFRYYLFDVFFNSGINKLESWDSTLFQFEYLFNVTWLPLPPPLVESLGIEPAKAPHVFAAYSGTAAELVLPVLILLGIGGRLPALALFIFNYIALVSFPDLWTLENIGGFKDHIIWGVMIAVTLFYGHGKLSLDHILQKKVCENYRY